MYDFAANKVLHKCAVKLSALSIGVASISAFVIVAACLFFSANTELRARLEGTDILVDPTTIDLAASPPESTIETTVRVTNLSSEPIILTGIHTSCSCVLADSLPCTVGANDSHLVRITVHSPTTFGDFSRSAILYTGSKTTPQLSIAIKGRVAGSRTAAAVEDYSAAQSPPASRRAVIAEPTAVLLPPSEANGKSWPHDN